MAVHKLVYGGEEIRLRDEEDVAALAARIAGAAGGFVVVKDRRRAIHHLWVAPGVAIHLIDVTEVTPQPPAGVLADAD